MKSNLRYLAVAAAISTVSLAAPAFAQDAPKPAPAPQEPAKPAPAAKDEAPQATIDLLKRARTVLEHYWNANYEATVAKQEFKAADAWEQAAKAADFKDYKSFGEAIAAQRKADAVHFGKRYDAMRKEIEAAHREKLAKLNKPG